MKWGTDILNTLYIYVAMWSRRTKWVSVKGSSFIIVVDRSLMMKLFADTVLLRTVYVHPV